ncbi:MAG: O-antigen ligase family protein [Bacilli bacterium]|nr:O-antigen ligase family protein [Bacilli bacterium]MDD4733566.1 O-antigen ligase family protein [Bacilli bacterium]
MLKSDKNKEILLYIFLLIQPIIDITTSLMVRLTDFPITIGIVIRGFVLLLLVIYVLFLSKSKYRKNSLIYYSIILIFVIFYLLTKEDIFTLSILKGEIIFLFKYFYFPVILVGFLNIYDEYKLERNKIISILTLNLILMAILIILPYILGTGFSSYVGDRRGNVGWFFSANEVSAIICILFPFLWLKLNEKMNFVNFLIVILIVLISFIIGTKTAYLSVSLPMICIVIYHSIKMEYKKMIVPIFFVVLIISLLPISPLSYNLNQSTKEATNLGRTGGRSALYSLFSGRDDLLDQTAKIYIDSNDVNKYFGIGVTNRSDINNVKIEKMIESDIFDILFRLGIIGTFIYFAPLIAIFLVCFEYVIIKKLNLNLEQWLIFYTVVIGLLACLITGHVLGAPAVSIYLAIATVLAFTMKEEQI